MCVCVWSQLQCLYVPKSVCVIVCVGGCYPNHFQSHTAHLYRACSLIIIRDKSQCCTACVGESPVCWTCCAGLLTAWWCAVAGTEAASHKGEHTALTSELDWGLKTLWAGHTKHSDSGPGQALISDRTAVPELWSCLVFTCTSRLRPSAVKAWDTMMLLWRICSRLTVLVYILRKWLRI